MYRRLLSIFVAGMLGLHILFFWHVRSQVRQGYADFTIFYAAGKTVRSGLGRSLYDARTQYSAQREFAGDVQIRQGPLPYNHPPFEALLFLPLTFLPYGYAFLTWDAVNLALLLVVHRILRRRFLVLHGVAPWQWLVGLLAWYPVFITLVQGQDSIVLLLFYVLAFEELERKADFSAGCWLGLGVFRPQLIVPMVLILFLGKRRRVAGGAVVVSVALTLVSAAVVGWSGLIHYPLYVWRLERGGGGGAIPPGLMANVRGLAETLLGGVVAPGMTLALTLVASAILLWFAVDSARVANAAFDLKFALALVVTLLVSYHSYAYDWCLLVLPVVAVTEQGLRSREGSLTEKMTPMLPVIPLLISPVFLILWLRWHNLSLLAVPLLLWLWAIRREISRTGSASPPNQGKTPLNDTELQSSTGKAIPGLT